MNALILALVAALSFSSPVRGQHAPEIPPLSAEGRAAYERIALATIFAIGPVGIAGTTSEQEKALRTLLGERNATAALSSLAKSATPAGRLYGLAGLSVRDADGASKLARTFATESGETEVQEMSGCIVAPTKVGAVCARIERGDYASQLGRPVRGR